MLEVYPLISEVYPLVSEVYPLVSEVYPLIPGFYFLIPKLLVYTLGPSNSLCLWFQEQLSLVSLRTVHSLWEEIAND